MLLYRRQVSCNCNHRLMWHDFNQRAIIVIEWNDFSALEERRWTLSDMEHISCIFMHHAYSCIMHIQVSCIFSSSTDAFGRRFSTSAVLWLCANCYYNCY